MFWRFLDEHVKKRLFHHNPPSEVLQNTTETALQLTQRDTTDHPPSAATKRPRGTKGRARWQWFQRFQRRQRRDVLPQVVNPQRQEFISTFVEMAHESTRQSFQNSSKGFQGGRNNNAGGRGGWSNNTGGRGGWSKNAGGRGGQYKSVRGRGGRNKYAGGRRGRNENTGGPAAVCRSVNSENEFSNNRESLDGSSDAYKAQGTGTGHNNSKETPKSTRT